MPSELDLSDPIAVALAIVRALRDARIEAALYGGLALAAYGEPRETRDADFAIAGTGSPGVLEALERAGLRPILAFDRVRFGGHRISRLTLVEGGGATGLNSVDLVEPRSPRFARAALARAMTGSLRGTAIAILAPEDFILFKVLSTRDRDLEDARTVLGELGPRLDHALLDREVAALATEIPDHEVASRHARLRRPG
jgi:hypothetical protein